MLNKQKFQHENTGYASFRIGGREMGVGGTYPPEFRRRKLRVVRILVPAVARGRRPSIFIFSFVTTEVAGNV